MSERILRCPNCGASLTLPSKWARETVCSYCKSTVLVDPSVVSAAPFRRAFDAWNTREGMVRVAGLGYRCGGRLATGRRADVYLGESVRSPSARVILKVLREGDAASLEREWTMLVSVAREDPGATLGYRIPELVGRGVVEGGAFAGRAALVYRWAPRFIHTLTEVRARSPRGVDVRVATWIWRRVLETLEALHRRGVAHGNVDLEHVVVENGEHGVRLVGFGGAMACHANAISRDLSSTATMIGALVDPSHLRAPFAELVEQVAKGAFGGDAWQLREDVGQMARSTFGPPSFHPLELD